MSALEVDPSATITAVVLAKVPRLGHSKTRLIPAFGPHGAARLAAAALVDTLDAVRRSTVTDRVLALDGDVQELPDPTSTRGFRIIPQAAGSHTDRLIAAFETATGPAVLVGMDTPQLASRSVELDLAEPVEAWFGPAMDGGWWVLGLRHPRRDARRVLDGVPMSTPQTGRLTRDRLLACGLRIHDLAVLRDVDEGEDAIAVARQAPHLRFSRLVAQLRAGQDATPPPPSRAAR
ncbi:MAG: DUF2064 domain-containing protein [Kineosporiaceae bacterium]